MSVSQLMHDLGQWGGLVVADHAQRPEGTVESFVVLYNRDTPIKFMIQQATPEPESTGLRLPTVLLYAAHHRWEERVTVEGQVELRVFKHVADLTNLDAVRESLDKVRALPVTSVFFTWSGFLDALMFDRRVTRHLRAHMVARHERKMCAMDTERKKDGVYVTAKPVRHAVRAYLRSLKEEPTNELPELPIEWFDRSMIV